MSSFDLGPGIDHLRDSWRILTRANKVVETRDVTVETSPVTVVPSVQLRQPVSLERGGAHELGEASEPGGVSELRETPERGGGDDFDSGPLTSLPLLSREVLHQRRVTPPPRSAGCGDEGDRGSAGGENMSAVGTTTASSSVYSPSMSSEPSADGDVTVTGSETSPLNESNPVPTMARTVARQFELPLLGSRVGEGLERTRAQTRARNQEAVGLVNMFGPYEEGKLSCGLRVVQVTRRPGELPKWLVWEAGPEPVSYPAACSSECSDVWMRAMKMEFEGPAAAGTFAGMIEFPEGCDVVDAKRYKRNGDSHAMIGRVRAHMAAMGYSEEEKVDYFEKFARTASATSHRLVSTMACKLDWDPRHLL